MSMEWLVLIRRLVRSLCGKLRETYYWIEVRDLALVRVPFITVTASEDERRNLSFNNDVVNRSRIGTVLILLCS